MAKKSKVQIEKEQQDFLNRPSKLSRGAKNLRFKGTVKSNFYLRTCSDQSGRNQ